MFSVHYYNYFGDAWDMNNYQVVRFSSEYGFQALPSMETLISAAESDEDLKLGSSFLKARQHLSGGDSYIKSLIRNNLIIPKGNNSRKDLENLVYLSQVDQAVSIKTETESHRQWKSSLDSDNRGLSSGALYWQLNDVWQAPSWSSIGKKKSFDSDDYFFAFWFGINKFHKVSYFNFEFLRVFRFWWTLEDIALLCKKFLCSCSCFYKIIS